MIVNSRSPSAFHARSAEPRPAVSSRHIVSRPGPFRRCQRRRRRPLLNALLALAAPLVFQGAAPLFAQDAPLPQVKESRVAGININTASATELAEALNGVGGARAEAIVRYREQFGPFESIEELSEVTGIGSATIERNRDLLRIR